ncbi:DsbA family protein [Actinoplanes sp. G11-F43]|uniref:mycothiol-dependent nitroreductase Rv2466c family protein n=1 Tax=Actinoplanes sp. G11-F43 TaxID=3424130 RepID=UPI003D33E859
MKVTFYFDPACPFTWRTSRWLLAVAPERGLEIHWRAFSLALLGGETPEKFRSALAASIRALRLVESLRSEGRHDVVAAFYTGIGERTHDVSDLLSDEVVAAAAEAAGVTHPETVLGDAAWDDTVKESHETAMALAGPGIGSPVLHLEGSARGLHGPVIGEVPSPADGLVIWDSTAALSSIDYFFEVKRGRG